MLFGIRGKDSERVGKERGGSVTLMVGSDEKVEPKGMVSGGLVKPITPEARGFASVECGGGGTPREEEMCKSSELRGTAWYGPRDVAVRRCVNLSFFSSFEFFTLLSS